MAKGIKAKSSEQTKKDTQKNVIKDLNTALRKYRSLFGDKKFSSRINKLGKSFLKGTFKSTTSVKKGPPKKKVGSLNALKGKPKVQDNSKK
jgi:hypothetical protein